MFSVIIELIVFFILMLFANELTNVYHKMAFVWIFLQELVTGKGVIQGIQEGDWFFLANAGLFGVSVLALTVWLAIKGENDYTKE